MNWVRCQFYFSFKENVCNPYITIPFVLLKLFEVQLPPKGHCHTRLAQEPQLKCPTLLTHLLHHSQLIQTLMHLLPGISYHLKSPCSVSSVRPFCFSTLSTASEDWGWFSWMSPSGREKQPSWALLNVMAALQRPHIFSK